MKPRKYIIDGYSVEQTENGHVWVKSVGDDSDFVRMHVQYYRRINKRTARQLVSTVRFLSEVEAMQ
jgi:hypothetical protein